MPLEELDLETVLYDRDAIRGINPHRFEMEQIDAVCFVDTDRVVVVGYRDLRADEFWVRGHIPGRPIFPGVLMIEAAAQLCSVMYYTLLNPKADHFFGFGGLDRVKFRGVAVPGDRLVFMARLREQRSRRWSFEAQAFIDDRMVFEAVVSGMVV